MRYDIPQKNLFDGLNGASDGVAAGYSQSVVGVGLPVYVTMFNAGGADVAIEFREIQQHIYATPDWVPVGKNSLQSEHIEVLLRKGFEYRFNVVAPGALRVAVHVTPIADDAYDNYRWFLYDHEHGEQHHSNQANYLEEFGWRCELPYVGNGFINPDPAQWVNPPNGNTLNGHLVIFDWFWGECGGIAWIMDVGTAPGLSDLGQYSGVFGEHAWAVKNLPTDGSPVHVTVHLACADGSVMTFAQAYTAATY